MKNIIPNKILIIGVILKKDSILMRKKFIGSKPYKETWYSFGTEFIPNENPEKTFKKYIKKFTGINVSVVQRLSWETEIKKDNDGVKKQFIYLNLKLKYISGKAVTPENHEKIAWIPIKKLSTIDIVPPSMKVFKTLGYIK